MNYSDEARMDEAIDLTSEHDRPEIFGQFPELALLNCQDRAELAFSLLVSVSDTVMVVPTHSIVIRSNQVCLRS